MVFFTEKELDILFNCLITSLFMFSAEVLQHIVNQGPAEQLWDGGEDLDLYLELQNVYTRAPRPTVPVKISSSNRLTTEPSINFGHYPR